MSINEDQKQSLEEVAEMRSAPSEPIRLESESVFDPELLKRLDEDDDSFDDDPMNPIVKMLREYLESIKPPTAFTTPPKSEHKVRIYQLAEEYNLQAMEAFAAEIESFLNDGYCCHMPTVIGNYVIMDFSRRKESEEDGKQ